MWGFPGGGNSKETACWCRRCKRCEFDPWVEKIPWRGKWHSTPVVLPAIFQKQRILANYNPMEWGCKESDTTELLSMSCRSKFSAPMITRLRALPVSLQQNYLEPGGSSRIFPAITAAHNISFSSVWSIFLFRVTSPQRSQSTPLSCWQSSWVPIAYRRMPRFFPVCNERHPSLISTGHSSTEPPSQMACLATHNRVRHFMSPHFAMCPLTCGPLKCTSPWNLRTQPALEEESLEMSLR